MADFTVSNSELSTWARCRRKWLLTYYWRFGPDPARLLPFGNKELGQRVHLALEGAYGHNLDPFAVLGWVYNRVLRERPDCEKDIIKERDLAITMIEGFTDWAAETGLDAGYEVVAAERIARASIELPGGGEMELLTKLDVLRRRLDDGAVRFIDWKTTATLKKKLNELHGSHQMRTYALVQALDAQANPFRTRADGGEYVAILRSQRTARAKGPFYGTAATSYNRNDLNSAWQRVRAIGAEIRSARSKLDRGADHHEVAYNSRGEDCDWACVFRDICPLFDDGSRAEDMLTTEFTPVDPYAHYYDDTMEQAVAALREG